MIGEIFHPVIYYIDGSLYAMDSDIVALIWASSRQNLSSGFLTKLDSNQPAQLQGLARKLKFRL